MPITANVVSSKPVHGEVYSIQHYVIKFASDLRKVGGFHSNKTDHHNYNWNIVASGVKHHNHYYTHYSDNFIIFVSWIISRLQKIQSSCDL